MAKATIVSGSYRNGIYKLPFYSVYSSYYHLGNSVTVLYSLLFLRKIDENYFYLSPVICINGAGCIQTGYSLLDCQPASWTHLRLKTVG